MALHSVDKKKCDVIMDFCEYFMYQDDRNGETAIVFCNHPKNPDDYEGNCTKKLCPKVEND